MKQSRHHLAEVIAERTLHVYDPKQLAKEVAAYLLEQNLVSELDSLIRDVMNYRAERGMVEATAITAHELDQRDESDITGVLRQEYPHAKSITVDKQVDPNVIGGIKLEMPGEQLDLTVKAQLNLFKRLTAAGKE